MKPAPFEYLRAQSAEDAVAALAEFGEDARILAGGQSLIALMNFRLAQPSHLIDITRVDELDLITEEEDAIVIGAAVRQVKAEHSGLVRRACPLLADAIQLVAHPEGYICSVHAGRLPNLAGWPDANRSISAEASVPGTHHDDVIV